MRGLLGRGCWPLVLVAVVVFLVPSGARQGVGRVHAEEGDAGGRERWVARIADEGLSAAELATFWFSRYPEEYARTLDALLDARLARRVAAREGLGVPQPVLDAAVAAEVAARRAQWRSQEGPERPLEEGLAAAYGLGLDEWRERILRPRLYERLLLERVVRHEERNVERVEVRVLVRPDRASALALHVKLQAGADFAALARRESADPSAVRGGALPAFARGEWALPEVEAQLLAAPTGSLLGPLLVELDGRSTWHIYRVVARHAPWTTTGAARAAALERDLLALPLEAQEIERWRRRAYRDAPVERYRPDGRPW